MKKYYIILFFGFSFFLNAQTDSDFPSSEIEIIKSFNARLGTAKILSVPLPQHQVDTNRAFIRQYKLSDKPVKLQYPAPQVKPLAMERGENPSSYPFFAKIGYGLQNNPFAEIAYYTSSNRLNLLANASFESLKDLNNDAMKFQDIDAQVKANIGISDLIQLNTSIGYLRQNRNLYGRMTERFDRDPEFTYDIPQVHLGFQNAIETSANIDYAMDYTFRNTKDNFENKETNHQISGTITKAFEDSGFRIGIHGLVELNKLKNGHESTLNNYVFGIKAGLNQDRWNIAGGVDVALLDDETKLLPQALLNVFISPAARPYIGIKSQVKQNNFYSLSRQNPYLASTLNVLQNETSMDIFAGIQGKLKQANYELRIGYELADQKALFVNNFPDTATFIPVYDNVNTLSIALHSDAKIMNGLTVGAGLGFYSYNTDSLSEVWNLPSFTWDIFGTYDKLLSNKLAITASLNSQSGIKYLDANFENQKLGTYLNFSILLDYELSKKVTAFVHLNNLFDSQKQQYFGYDRVGINPQIGLTARF